MPGPAGAWGPCDPPEPEVWPASAEVDPGVEPPPLRLPPGLALRGRAGGRSGSPQSPSTALASCPGSIRTQPGGGAAFNGARDRPAAPGGIPADPPSAGLSPGKAARPSVG